ncbi:hypothetical protein ACFTWS_33775 [Streptomyces sp. NPDC057027]|uniref:hypothetical protein n=1 Tax=Streptomyces sp. NPDC057027 TaxID=3346004 RepID=UPI003637310C
MTRRKQSGDADWTLYVATHRDPAAGIVWAAVRATAPRRRYPPVQKTHGSCCPDDGAG